MIEYKDTRSAERPAEVDIKETKVFVATNIHTVEVNDYDMSDEPTTRIEYEFDYIEYTKDEYLHLMIERNNELENEITDTQLALCDVYEMLEG